MTGVLKLANGTVAAPSISFASEPGLGFYRAAAGYLSAAYAGAEVTRVECTSNNTSFRVFPTTAGAASITVYPDAASVSATNFSIGAIYVNSSAVGIGSVTGGTGVMKPVDYSGSAHRFNNDVAIRPGALGIQPITGDANIYLHKVGALASNVIYGTTSGSARWAIIPGAAQAESGGQQGSNFLIQSYLDSGAYLEAPFQITRGTGMTTCKSLTSTGTLIANSGIDVKTASVVIRQSLGLNMQGVAGDGSTYALQQCVIGNPSWNTMDMRTRHQFGQWAGIEWVTGNSPACQIRFMLSNGQSWGAVYAISFDVQSDATTKERIEPIVSALDRLDGIQAHSYRFKTTAVSTKETPIYGADRRRVGTMSQDWLERIPEAVTEVTPTGSDTPTLMLDYSAIGAVTAQAVSELLQRVKTLEARLAAAGL
jgi:hypothetical protein